MKSAKSLIKNYYDTLSRIIHESWAVVLPKSYVKYLYRRTMHEELNIKNPRDYNEKLEWLKLYSDISLWTNCADKYNVRDYIIQCGLGHILVDLYGVWRDANDMEFNKLPDRFVLKSTHGFGKTILVKDKSQLDIDKTKNQLNDWLKVRYGLVTFEPHAWKINRQIIAEELLYDNYNASLSSSLIDYKFWCIHGEPQVIVAMANRENTVIGTNEKSCNLKFQYFAYDLNWNFRPEIHGSRHTRDNNAVLPRPQCLNEMIEICRILSKPFATVRVDLYEVNNKVYFGELTFTPGGSRNYFTPEFFRELGEKIDLSRVELRKGRSII